METHPYSDGVFFPGVGSLQRIVANVSQRVGGRSLPDNNIIKVESIGIYRTS